MANSLRLDNDDRARFAREGFLLMPAVIPKAQVERLRTSFPKLFDGQFDTGVYPDEWYWRKELSLPDVTRHIGNAWKSDLEVARLALSRDIARTAAELAGWPNARLGQDTIWWKPPGAKPVAYHQDSSFMDFLDPPLTMTCWITLDDASAATGTIEYAPGSHHWRLTSIPKSFHAHEDYRAQMVEAALAAGVAPPEPVAIEAPAGSCVFHAGETWHGSGPNLTHSTMRRAIGLHFIRGDARFSERSGGYIYRRYQRVGSSEMDESFFPLVWSREGPATVWIDEYCRTGRRA